MQSALWKTVALVSVIGIGGFVVVKVHHELQRQQQSTATNGSEKFAPVEGVEDASGGSSDPDAIVTLGPARETDAADDFNNPPFDQVEPAPDDGGSDFSVAGRREQQPQLAEPEDDGAAASHPFLMAGSRDPASPEVAPADFSNDPPYDPFSGAAGDEPAGSGPATAALTTADARFPAQPQDTVEQVVDVRALTGAGNFDPNAGPGLAVDNGAVEEAGIAADDLVLPDQPDRLPATENLSTAAEPNPLPELSFDQAEPESADNPFGAGPVQPLARDAAPDDASANPFGQEFGPEPAGETLPTLEFGDPAVPESELALPESESALPDDDSSPGGLPAASLPAEPTDDPNLNSATDPGPTSPGAVDANWLDTSEPSAESALEPSAEVAAEPSRFPVTGNNTGLPAASIRSPGLSPLTPPPANPLPEIRPVNPDVKPGALRPEFVGEGTLDVDAPAGPQQPELTIQKLAPPNATVGEPLVYAIKVKNVGKSTARDVIVEDKIPRGTTLQGSIPQAELIDKKLIWQLGHMEPGDETTIRIKVVPNEAGEVGSVATVRFVAEVAATTKITTPKLSMDVQGPGEVAVGEQVVFHFRLSNSGDGAAHNVYIRNLLPAGFQHPGGNDIEYEVGVLKPGESRAIDLAVTATEVGQHALRAQLNTGTTVRDESTTPVNVIKSRLLIQRSGPKRRFVGRPADYETVVSNRSSRPLERIEVVEQLPAGMELAAAPEGGHFDPERRTITWRIAELAPGAGMKLKTSVIASEQGTLRGAVTAVDAAGNQAQLKSELEVAGFAALKVDLEHDGRPVGVGESVAMQLRVKNRGTGAAEHVQALFDIPDHLEFVNAEGPVTFEQQGRTVKFAAINELAANEEQTFKIMLTAAAPGNTPVTAQLTTAALDAPLQQSEAVNVEADNP